MDREREISHVEIGGDEVSVGGDVVGGNKIVHLHYHSDPAMPSAALGKQSATAEYEWLSPGPKFVNREVQEREFKDFWDRARLIRPGAAQIYLLPSMDVDCPKFFTDRLRDDTVERLARSFKSVDKASVYPVSVWTEPCYQNLEVLQRDLSFELFSELNALGLRNLSQLSAQPLAKLDSLRHYTFVLIEQTINTDSAAGFLGKLIRWYCDSFWGGFRSDIHFLVFLHLRCPAPKRERSQLVGNWFPRRAAARGSYMILEDDLKQILPGGEDNLAPNAVGAPVKQLPTLAPIQLTDIKCWLERLRVQAHMVDRDAQRLFDDMCQKCRSFGPDTRLSCAYDVLNDYFQEHLSLESLDMRQPQSTR